MGGLSCDRSVVRKGICYDCTKTYHSAFNVNNAGLQSSTIEGGRAAGWDRQSRGFDVERGGLKGAGERAVVEHPRDRPAGVVAEIGRVGAGRDVGAALQHLMVMGERVGSGSTSHAGAHARRDYGIL